MNLTLRNRAEYTVFLPKKIQSMKRTRTIMLVSSIAVAAAGGGLYYYQH
jgi:hypothetical protein